LRRVECRHMPLDSGTDPHDFVLLPGTLILTANQLFALVWQIWVRGSVQPLNVIMPQRKLALPSERPGEFPVTCAMAMSRHCGIFSSISLVARQLSVYNYHC
jgi:hypothetical protein